jgi:hypothetical protein
MNKSMWIEDLPTSPGHYWVYFSFPSDPDEVLLEIVKITKENMKVMMLNGEPLYVSDVNLLRIYNEPIKVPLIPEE